MKKLTNSERAKRLKMIKSLIQENTHGTVCVYDYKGSDLIIYENNDYEVLFRADEVMNIAHSFCANAFVEYGELPVTIKGKDDDLINVLSNMKKLFVRVYFN